MSQFRNPSRDGDFGADAGAGMSDVASGVRLGDLAAAVEGEVRPSSADRALQIFDVTHDSRQAAPGVLFAARPGAVTDGHDHAPAAVAAGSPAIMVERLLRVDVPQLQVPSVALALGPAAAVVHGHPGSQMALLAVTGTNGKTTTAFLVEAGLAAAGHTTGLIGTVETRAAGEVVAGVRTTPEASDLQRLLRRMRDRGVSAAAMEVSSHGLALGRVRGTRFAAVGFTNLSHDHLDFHGTVEDYYRAKATLFTPSYADVAVINVDDPAGRRLADSTPLEVMAVSIAGGPDTRVFATDVQERADGSRFAAVIDGRRIDVRVRLAGAFNVSNALIALGLLAAAGVDPALGADGIAALEAVPGRMERVRAGQPFEVIVDYAHTPDALERVLAAVRRVARGRVMVVIGCGGDRDTVKRPIMGRVAAAGADIAVLTSDNPRTEDPEAILDAVAAGAREVAGARVVRIADRRAAIGAAVAEAKPDDVVLIAGKGHERVQEHAGVTMPFDDREVAGEALAAHGYGPQGYHA